MYKNRPCQPRSGVSLIELLFAISVIVVAHLGLMSPLSSSTSLQGTSREKVLAYNAARQQIETMRNTTQFSQIYTPPLKEAPRLNPAPASLVA